MKLALGKRETFLVKFLLLGEKGGAFGGDFFIFFFAKVLNFFFILLSKGGKVLWFKKVFPKRGGDLGVGGRRGGKFPPPKFPVGSFWGRGGGGGQVSGGGKLWGPPKRWGQFYKTKCGPMGHFFFC